MGTQGSAGGGGGRSSGVTRDAHAWWEDLHRRTEEGENEEPRL